MPSTLSIYYALKALDGAHTYTLLTVFELPSNALLAHTPTLACRASENCASAS